MRQIAVRLLVLSVGYGLAGCVPDVPSLGAIPSPARDAALESLTWVGSPPAEAPARPPTSGHADAIAAPDAVHLDAGTEVRDARGEVAEARPEASDARPDGAASDAMAGADASSARQPRVGDIRIDELLVDPAGNDLGHEWLELANVAAEALDVGGLHLSDGTTDVALDAGALAPGARLVLGQSADRAHNGDTPVAIAYGTRLAFNNDADRVAVCLGACAAGITLDAFAWTAPLGDAYVGHAVVLDPNGNSCPATEPYGSSGDFGTPGQANPPCPAAPAYPPADADGRARDGAAEAGDAAREVLDAGRSG